MSDGLSSLQKNIRQRIKGTHDSPCLSACTHKRGDVICGSCGMLREDKKGWKRRDESQKQIIRENAKQRLIEQRRFKEVS